MKRDKLHGPWTRYARGRNRTQWNLFWKFPNFLDRVDAPAKGPEVRSHIWRAMRQR